MQRRTLLFGMGAFAGGLSAGTRVLSDGETEADGEVPDPRRGTQEIIWSVATGVPMAALTFDDGPHPELTPRILDVLDDHDVKATFMVMGYSAEQHPDLLAEVVARGHEVGNHTWSHVHVTKTSAQTTRREIEQGTHVLEDIAGVRARLFRPPQGRLSETVVRLVRSLDQDIVLWSVSRGKKRWRAPDAVARHVVEHVGPGDIIDLHDGLGRGTFEPGTPLADTLMARRQAETAALPRILEQLGDRGLRLGTVSQLRSVRDQAPTT